ncbi:MAG: flavin reductase [Planctomycetaceae bacterium]|jgi:flavin reductase (DIM6/NTAB) family NADH-FMN oxidoreductase RutF/rubredoxin|nr:flavin reductase [Planctomycetaceae bacterium]
MVGYQMDEVLRQLTYGLHVIGALDGKRPTGCIVNTVIQVTSSPQQVVLSINHKNFTSDCIKKLGLFSVSILSEGAIGDLIRRFGFSSGKDVNKFDGITFANTASGLPVLETGVCGWLECRVKSTTDLGSHALLVAEITGAKKLNSVNPMTYTYYHRVIKGGAPPNAPTFVEKPVISNKSGKHHICPLCGYEYDGSHGDFESLPENWSCPICGAAKATFEIE